MYVTHGAMGDLAAALPAVAVLAGQLAGCTAAANLLLLRAPRLWVAAVPEEAQATLLQVVPSAWCWKPSWLTMDQSEIEPVHEHRVTTARKAGAAPALPKAMQCSSLVQEGPQKEGDFAQV